MIETFRKTFHRRSSWNANGTGSRRKNSSEDEEFTKQRAAPVPWRPRPPNDTDGGVSRVALVNGIKEEAARKKQSVCVDLHTLKD